MVAKGDEAVVPQRIMWGGVVPVSHNDQAAGRVGKSGMRMQLGNGRTGRREKEVVVGLEPVRNLGRAGR